MDYIQEAGFLKATKHTSSTPLTPPSEWEILFHEHRGGVQVSFFSFFFLLKECCTNIAVVCRCVFSWLIYERGMLIWKSNVLIYKRNMLIYKKNVLVCIQRIAHLSSTLVSLVLPRILYVGVYTLVSAL